MSKETRRENADWSAVIDLIERVMAEDDLLPHVVAGVRATVSEVAVLPVADVATHTRALLTAATRALAARRGPNEAELAFVAELAETRARQGIPIEAVLGAIHMAGRAIWARARELAADEGIGEGQLLDARELYDDWSETVRSRLIRADRDARSQRVDRRRDRQSELVRRLIDGGSAASLAAAEAGFGDSTLWVLVARLGEERAEEALRRILERDPKSLCAPTADTLVGVSTRRPAMPAGLTVDPGWVIGLAGPVGTDEVALGHRLAASAVPAAEASGRAGVVHVADVASAVALLTRSDLSAVLMARHDAARRELRDTARPVAESVIAWVQRDRDTNAAADALFVHANTVRNRIQRFTQVTGIDPAASFGAVDAWLVCQGWLSGQPQLSDRPV